MTTNYKRRATWSPPKTKITESKAGHVRRITTEFKAPKKSKKSRPA